MEQILLEIMLRHTESMASLRVNGARQIWWAYTVELQYWWIGERQLSSARTWVFDTVLHDRFDG